MPSFYKHWLILLYIDWYKQSGVGESMEKKTEQEVFQNPLQRSPVYNDSIQSTATGASCRSFHGLGSELCAPAHYTHIYRP